MSSKLQFWKPGTQRPGSSVDRDSEIEGNIVPSAPASGNLSIASQRERLPIFKHSMWMFLLLSRFVEPVSQAFP